VPLAYCNYVRGCARSALTGLIAAAGIYEAVSLAALGYEKNLLKQSGGDHMKARLYNFDVVPDPLILMIRKCRVTSISTRGKARARKKTPGHGYGRAQASS